MLDRPASTPNPRIAPTKDPPAARLRVSASCYSPDRLRCCIREMVAQHVTDPQTRDTVAAA